MLKMNDELEKIYLEKLKDQLVNGLITTSTHKTSRRVERYDADDNLIEYTVENKEKTIENRLPCPESIMKILYESLGVESSILYLQRMGYVVVDPSMIENKEESKGLSDSTINLIKRSILGIED